MENKPIKIQNAELGKSYILCNENSSPIGFSFEIIGGTNGFVTCRIDTGNVRSTFSIKDDTLVIRTIPNISLAIQP